MKTPLGLSKEDVANLSPELQDTVARIALADGKRRRQILNQARGYGGGLREGIVFAILGVILWHRISDSRELLFWVTIGLFGLIQSHAIMVNRRIDAACEMLEEARAREDEAAQPGK